METFDAKASKSHLCQKLDNNIERMLSAYIRYPSNTFTSNSLNPSLSPFRDAGTWVETYTVHKNLIKMIILNKNF